MQAMHVRIVFHGEFVRCEQLQGGDGVPGHKNGKLTPMHIKDLLWNNRLFRYSSLTSGLDNAGETAATITINISKDEKSHDVLWRCV